MVTTLIIKIFGTFSIFYCGYFYILQDNPTGVWVAKNPLGIWQPNLHPSEYEYDTLTIKSGKFSWKTWSFNSANTKLYQGNYRTKGDTLTLYIKMERSLFIEETSKYIKNEKIKDKTVILIIDKHQTEDFILKGQDKNFERILK